MKKLKRTYSLTAKERKAKRYGNDNNKKEDPRVEADPLQAAEAEMTAARTRTRRSAVIIGVSVTLAVLLILAAVIVPIVMYVVNPYRGLGKVVAKFELSNGMELEFIIEEETYDVAATNFIFLAKNGFFDDTVFYDAQNGWLRFGGYTAQPQTNSGTDYSRTHHRRDDVDYCNNFTAIKAKFERPTYKFGYRLRPESKGLAPAATHLLQSEGVLAFLYDNTSTEFQVSYDASILSDNVTAISGNDTTTNVLKPTMVGRVLNDETLQNIKRIASTAKLNESITSGNLWRPPSPDIRIEKVKLYNLNDDKWDNFDFVEYVSGKNGDGQNRQSGWTGKV